MIEIKIFIILSFFYQYQDEDYYKIISYNSITKISVIPTTIRLGPGITQVSISPVFYIHTHEDKIEIRGHILYMDSKIEITKLFLSFSHIEIKDENHLLERYVKEDS